EVNTAREVYPVSDIRKVVSFTLAQSNISADVPVAQANPADPFVWRESTGVGDRAEAGAGHYRVNRLRQCSKSLKT
ncbi:hypothetical protein FRC07_001262, partial [Ceratobasidium sp. 392]